MCVRDRDGDVVMSSVEDEKQAAADSKDGVELLVQQSIEGPAPTTPRSVKEASVSPPEEELRTPAKATHIPAPDAAGGNLSSSGKMSLSFLLQ